jgi:hypothetical protein
MQDVFDRPRIGAVRRDRDGFPDRERPVASDAGVVELVDAPDSKSGSERSVGSIPTARTNFFQV